MFIAKAKNITEALVKSDALEMPRNKIIIRLVSDGAEIHNPSQDIIGEIKLWRSDWADIERKPRRSANFW